MHAHTNSGFRKLLVTVFASQLHLRCASVANLLTEQSCKHEPQCKYILPLMQCGGAAHPDYCCHQFGLLLAKEGAALQAARQADTLPLTPWQGCLHIQSDKADFTSTSGTTAADCSVCLKTISQACCSHIGSCSRRWSGVMCVCRSCMPARDAHTHRAPGPS